MQAPVRSVPKRSVPSVAKTQPAQPVPAVEVILPPVSRSRAVPTKAIKPVPVITAPIETPKIAPVEQKVAPVIKVPEVKEITAVTNSEVLAGTQDEWKSEYPGQVTIADMVESTLTAQHMAWTDLQKLAPEFGYIPLLKPSERRQKLFLRLKDAKLAGTAGKPFSGQMWCPYCGCWRTFRNHNGYERCVGCGISTMDYYTRSDNHLWGDKKEDREFNKRRREGDE